MSSDDVVLSPSLSLRKPCPRLNIVLGRRCPKRTSATTAITISSVFPIPNIKRPHSERLQRKLGSGESEHIARLGTCSNRLREAATRQLNGFLKFLCILSEYGEESNVKKL